MIAFNWKNIRRSVTGILGVFNIHPIPDGETSEYDMQHITNLYSGSLWSGNISGKIKYAKNRDHFFSGMK